MNNAESTTENFQIFIEHDLKLKVWSLFQALINFFVLSRSWEIWVFEFALIYDPHPVQSS